MARPGEFGQSPAPIAVALSCQGHSAAGRTGQLSVPIVLNVQVGGPASWRAMGERSRSPGRCSMAARRAQHSKTHTHTQYLA